MFEEFQLQSSDADQALLKVNISEKQEDFGSFFSFCEVLLLRLQILPSTLWERRISTLYLWKKCVDALEQTKAAEERSRVSTAGRSECNHHQKSAKSSQKSTSKRRKTTVDQQLSVKSSSQLNNLLCVQINEVKLPTLLQKEKTSLPSFLPSFLPSLFSCSCQTIQTRANRKKKWNFCKGRPAAAPTPRPPPKVRKGSS